MLWSQSSFSFDELPSLQDALRDCEKDLLARVVLSDHTLAGKPFAAYGKKRVRAMRRRLGKTIDEFCELELPLGGRGGHWMLLPQEVFLLGPSLGVMERRLQAALVSLDDVRVVECARAALGQRVGTYRHVRQAQKRARRRVRNAYDSEVPMPKEYRCLPWEDVLACKVWLGNGLCRRERYMVLAEAVWEMTFHGFSRAEVQAKAARERSAGGDSLCSGTAPSVPNLAELDLGLTEPDYLERGYVRALSRRLAVLNHNALIDLYDLQLDVSARCGMGV